MRSQTWTKPTFHELNLSAEIGMYFEDGDYLPSAPPNQNHSPEPSAALASSDARPPRVSRRA